MSRRAVKRYNPKGEPTMKRKIDQAEEWTSKAGSVESSAGPDWWFDIKRHWIRYLAGIIIGLGIALFAMVLDRLNFQWVELFN